MQKRHVRNVLHDSTAVAAVRQTPITSKGKSMMFTKWAASWKRKRVECAIMIKAAMAEEEV